MQSTGILHPLEISSGMIRLCFFDIVAIFFSRPTMIQYKQITKA